MIYYLKGKTELKEQNFVVIDVAGVGYKVFCSAQTLKKLPENKEIKIFTYLYLKENVLELYGFLTIQDLKLFEVLNKISGVGPKAASAISSLGSLDQLKKAIKSGNQNYFQGIKGLGQKKIQKIILELSGKIGEFELTTRRAFLQSEENREVIDALTGLGFSVQKVKEVLDKIPKEIKDTEQRIKQALKILGR